MEISLIRHGKSEHTDNQLLSAKEFKTGGKNYDSSSVLAELEYPPDTLGKMAAAKMVLASDLIRSIDSAQLLQPAVTAMIDELFWEAFDEVMEYQAYSGRVDGNFASAVAKRLFEVMRALS